MFKIEVFLFALTAYKDMVSVQYWYIVLSSLYLHDWFMVSVWYLYIVLCSFYLHDWFTVSVQYLYIVLCSIYLHDWFTVSVQYWYIVLHFLYLCDWFLCHTVEFLHTGISMVLVHIYCCHRCLLLVFKIFMPILPV